MALKLFSVEASAFGEELNSLVWANDPDQARELWKEHRGVHERNEKLVSFHGVAEVPILTIPGVCQWKAPMPPEETR